MSRRIMMTTYDPSVAAQGVLYPCHGIVTQFYADKVTSKNPGIHYRLHCKTYQRSADWFLGVPFNIASYALLVNLIIKHVNSQLRAIGSNVTYHPGTLSMDFGDVHLYESHVEAALIQLGRPCLKSPKLYIVEDVDLLDPNYYKDKSHTNFKLVNYKCGKSIKAGMIV
jgi:thymidylate synthase